jgi:hypothetical protein
LFFAEKRVDEIIVFFVEERSGAGDCSFGRSHSNALQLRRDTPSFKLMLDNVRRTGSLGHCGRFCQFRRDLFSRTSGVPDPALRHAHILLIV